MYEGKPLVLVVGGTDTGRTPMTAALLRRALGQDVIVRTAGVLSHSGEGATTEAQMAMDQLGFDISRHISHPLRDEDHRNAELLLAVDRGTELVLFTQFHQDARVACLPVLSGLPDVLDPHRMPLGVWIATARQLDDQIKRALPALRQRLRLGEAEPPPALTESGAPLVGFGGGTTNWANDADMERLMGLIDSAPTGSFAEDDKAAELLSADEWRSAGADDQQLPPLSDDPNAPPEADTPANNEPISRTDHVARMLQLLTAAQHVPEIIDWSRLRRELINRMRRIGQQPADTTDLVAAAVLMLEGKLGRHTTPLSAPALAALQQSLERLDTPLSAADLAAIGSEVAQW